MSIQSTQLIDSLILPPGGPLLLTFLGLILWKLRFGRRIFVLGLALLWMLSLPVTEKWLLAGLETYPALTPRTIDLVDANAIVLLGTWRYQNAPEYGGDTASPQMLMRMRYAARLAKQLNLPVIPSGGVTNNIGKAEARIYADILQSEYGIQVEHMEPRSLNTWENARYTAQLLKKLEIKKFLLVTDAAHMPRSIYAFKRNGLDPIAAPTGFSHTLDRSLTWEDFLPNPYTIPGSAYALHEYLGWFWYSLK